MLICCLTNLHRYFYGTHLLAYPNGLPILQSYWITNRLTVTCRAYVSTTKAYLFSSGPRLTSPKNLSFFESVRLITTEKAKERHLEMVIYTYRMEFLEICWTISCLFFTHYILYPYWMSSGEATPPHTPRKGMQVFKGIAWRCYLFDSLHIHLFWDGWAEWTSPQKMKLYTHSLCWKSRYGIFGVAQPYHVSTWPTLRAFQYSVFVVLLQILQYLEPCSACDVKPWKIEWNPCHLSFDNIVLSPLNAHSYAQST